MSNEGNNRIMHNEGNNTLKMFNTENLYEDFDKVKIIWLIQSIKVISF